MPEYKRDKILSETMYIFIPLAHRLGLYEIKSEMENIWLRYKEPDAYKDLTSRIEANVIAREEEIGEFISKMQESIAQAGFDFVIHKRIKTAYSIWRKMQTKNVPFEQVYDLYAIRIVFTPSADSKETERDQCYHIFSIITGIYRYKPERVRDWVKHPKSNGYEALHCTLMTERGLWIEVQIRSKRMDDIAENGFASHWSYKGIKREETIASWLGSVRYALEHPGSENTEDLPQPPSKEIFVFTPSGELRILAAGSSVLDFAFGVVAMVAMTPLITIQSLGFKSVMSVRRRKSVAMRRILEAADDQIIYFE
jgi:GTP pyrophosphokinase